MGNISSQQMKNNVNLLNKAIFDQINSIVNNDTSNCQNNQVIQAYFGVIPTGNVGGQTTFANCVPQAVFNSNINTNQSAVTNCNLTSSTSQTIQTSFTNSVSNALDQVAKATTSQNADWLSSALNVGIQNINNTQDVANLFKSAINNNVMNTCVSNAIANQNIQQIYCGVYYGDININQNSTVASIADCASQAVLSAFAANKDVNKLVQEADATMSQRTQGLVALLSQYKWIILGIAVILIIALILFLFIFLRPHGGSSTTVAIPGVTTPASPTGGSAQQQLVNTLIANPQLLALI